VGYLSLRDEKRYIAICALEKEEQKERQTLVPWNSSALPGKMTLGWLK